MMDLDSAIQHCEEVARQNEEDAILFSNCKKYKENLYEIGLAENAEKKCCKCAEEHRQLAEWLKELKAYKETWNKLGMWLADTRLAIAPDEFLNDVDEELVRVAQVDMIDTVLEWMDKQEVSQE